MKHKSTTINQAKNLRKNMTPQEIKLWNILRNNNLNGLKFRRQVPIGNYVAETKKYKVIRFWNNDIDNNIEGVVEKILEVVE